MGCGRTVSFIAAGIMIFFGVLFIWATFSPNGQTGWLAIGLISVLIGFALIYVGYRMRPEPEQGAGAGTTLTIDLPGEVKIESMKCQKCGGTLSSENVQMVAGAPVVSCPFCGSTYQLTEEPKW